MAGFSTQLWTQACQWERCGSGIKDKNQHSSTSSLKMCLVRPVRTYLKFCFSKIKGSARQENLGESLHPMLTLWTVRDTAWTVAVRASREQWKGRHQSRRAEMVSVQSVYWACSLCWVLVCLKDKDTVPDVTVLCSWQAIAGCHFHYALKWHVRMV